LRGLQGDLSWTEKISLGTIRDPLQLAFFRYPEEYFISGIITQTDRLRYYTFLTWAWTQIKERKSDLKKNEIRDLEKILTLASAIHHLDGLPHPNGIRSIDAGMEYIKNNQKIQLEKFQNFGRNNEEGYGNYYYRGSIENLDILWSENNSIRISPSAKEISKIFSIQLGSYQNNLWRKSLSKSDLKNMSSLCCCNISKQEQNFWIKIFFGLTQIRKSGLETDPDKKLILKNPDELSFEKFQVSEDLISESDLDEVLTNFTETKSDDTNFSETKSDDTSREMRTGSLLMILKIVKETMPTIERTFLLQMIRDCIYYSQFQTSDSVKSVKYGKLEWYRKYWEVYVHNLYYINILESTLEIITDICQENPLGIDIDDLTYDINDDKYLKFIKKFGFSASKKDSIDFLFTQVETILMGKKTSLSNPLNEHEILQLLIDSQSDSEIMAITLVLLLLCKYRFSFFNEKQLQILSYKQDKFASVFPENIYREMNSIKIIDFPNWIFKFIIKRHRHVSAKKLLNSGTKAWLFTEEGRELFFNEQYSFTAYRDGKWINVLEILYDLGLVEKDTSKKFWTITNEGEHWLKKFQ